VASEFLAAAVAAADGHVDAHESFRRP
jgi:tellurite resistance protein